MKSIPLLLAVIAVVIVYSEGRRIIEDNDEYYPIEGRSRGSTCVIKSRSIDIEDDNIGRKSKPKQASITPGGGLFIPNAADEYESGGSEEDDENEQEDEDSGEEELQGYPPPGYPPQLFQRPSLLNGFGAFGNPSPYSPFAPQYDETGPSDPTSLTLSTPPNFSPYGAYPYGGPSTYEGKKKIKIKKESSSGKKKKKGGNINCIIITKGGKQKKKEPPKLFGFIPLHRRRRNVAQNIKAAKSQ